MKRCALIIAVWSLLCCGTALNQTVPPRRVALVIGNDTPRLATTRNDARAVAAALRELGFEVTLAEDVTQHAWRPLLEEFGARARGSEVSLFYFAGYATQFKGGNYLLSSGAKFKTNAQLKAASVAVNDLLAQFRAQSNLLLLDACRNHPSLRKAQRGLSTMRAPADTLIAFAAPPGTFAFDQTGQTNSRFTTALLQHLRTPDLSLNELFDRVRASVAAQTHGQQTPWTVSSLRGAIALRQAPAAPAAETKPANELADWQAIKDSTDANDFQTYLTKYPQGIYAETARSRLWQLTKAADEPEPARVLAPVTLPEPLKQPPAEFGPDSKPASNSPTPPPVEPPAFGVNPTAAEMQARAEWQFYNACYTVKNESVCCPLAAELAGKFPQSAYAWQATKRANECVLTAAWEKFQAALRDYYNGPDAAKLEKLFAAGEAFMRLRPNDPYVVAQLALAGSSAALGEIYRDLEKVKAYAEKALRVFEPTRTPDAEAFNQKTWENFRNDILSSQNQYLGYYYSKKDTVAADAMALSYFAKAVQVKAQWSFGWRDPNNYWLRTLIYDKQRQRLQAQFDTLPAPQQTGDTGKQLQTQINQLVDNLIADYARLVAVSNRPEYRFLREAGRSALESWWKVRHNGSLAGLEELIKRYEQDPSAP